MLCWASLVDVLAKARPTLNAAVNPPCATTWLLSRHRHLCGGSGLPVAPGFKVQESTLGRDSAGPTKTMIKHIGPASTALAAAIVVAGCGSGSSQLPSRPGVDASLRTSTPTYRVDEGQADFPSAGLDQGDRIYEWVVPTTRAYWFEGAGGGGGGGGGAGGRGPGKYQGGGGAGGNGGYCRPAYQLDLVKGTRIQIRLGHGGRGGPGGPSVDSFGSAGARGGDTVVSSNGAVLLNFPGASAGGGGKFCTIAYDDCTIEGQPGSASPPFGVYNYFFTQGGGGAAQGQAADPPRGGRGGDAGSSGGGGGGGASFRGTGAAGGNFVIPCNAADPPGRDGAFGSGGGGGAGGGPHTCDLGGNGGRGGQGYVWIFAP